MADIIARLLSGGDPGEPDRLFAPEGTHADRLAESREWCQTTPDHAAIGWLTAALGTGRWPRKSD